MAWRTNKRDTAPVTPNGLDSIKAGQIIDSVSTAVMMVNRDFVITFANRATVEMFRKYGDQFRKLWPGFDPDKVVGSCIDMFHRNPVHQRSLLSDPKNLPYRTDIAVGDVRFSLAVFATHDAKDSYDGNILEWADVTQTRSAESRLAATDRAQAVIEFTLDGKVLTANANFLSTLGYTLQEIKGQHHSLFVDPVYRASPDYRMFWEKLGRGEYDAGQYKRFGKGGKEVWIQASYTPVTDIKGKPYKVVKCASDVTAQVHDAQAMQAAVEETQAVATAARDGDLARRIPLEGKAGSIEQLCRGVNLVLDNMADVVGQVKVAAEAIDTAAKEISQGNTDLSQRTEEQASSLEETASSMEELTSTVKQNAENARQANQLAVGASDVAAKGGDVVKQVVHTMNGISESSKKIADIIGVIDGIAFQTNILALNAAVEAARAGEQGRGFAVVASEVRNLAQRSAAAAKEIKTLIGDSVEKVGAGSRLVDEAGKTMDEIVTSVKRVTDIMAEITAASQEQSSGIEQVNQAITQMDEVTQQNAALVEEAAAAAESLQEQAGNLVQAVAAYRVDQESAVERKPVGERRGPDRPSNIARISPKAPTKPARAAPAPARTKPASAPAPRKVAGGDDDWTEF